MEGIHSIQALMWYLAGAISLSLAFLNALLARKKGYFFWRTFFFTIILCIAIMAILSQLLV